MVVIPAGVPRKPGVCLEALSHVSLPVRRGHGFPLHRIESASLWQRIPQAPQSLWDREESLSWPGTCLHPARSAAPVHAICPQCPSSACCSEAPTHPRGPSSHISLPEPPPHTPAPPRASVSTCHTSLFLLQDRWS